MTDLGYRGRDVKNPSVDMLVHAMKCKFRVMCRDIVYDRITGLEYVINPRNEDAGPELWVRLKSGNNWTQAAASKESITILNYWG